MAPAPKIYTWTVRGRGSFPIDMLRYDQAWPFSESESGHIERSYQRGMIGQYTIVNLSSLKQNPTIGRWESFGWEVL